MRLRKRDSGLVYECTLEAINGYLVVRGLLAPVWGVLADGVVSTRCDSFRALSEMWEFAPGARNIWGDAMEVKELKCGLKIAMEDYYEIDDDGNKKTKFTFDEALEIEKKTNGKWRVPTVAEWMQIVLELGTTEDGGLDRDKLVKELNLAKGEYGSGRYWSSTSYSSTGAYVLYFSSSGVNPTYSLYRGYGLSVRCVLNEREAEC